MLSEPKPGKDQQQPHKQCRVADAGDDEGLPGGDSVRRLPVPETYEQITAQADTLPSHEHEEQVIREDQYEHGGHEEVHVGEEPPVPLFSLHELDRVDKDEKTHAGDHEHHDDRQGVEVERNPRLEISHAHPGPEHLRE